MFYLLHSQMDWIEYFTISLPLLHMWKREILGEYSIQCKSKTTKSQMT